MLLISTQCISIRNLVALIGCSYFYCYRPMLYTIGRPVPSLCRSYWSLLSTRGITIPYDRTDKGKYVATSFEGYSATGDQQWQSTVYRTSIDVGAANVFT